MKSRVRLWIIGSAASVVAVVAAIVGGVAYVNWSAEKRAHEFCDLIAVGSDISAATSRADKGGILWGSKAGYTFYFSGFIFDKAVCEASVDSEGKVISKKAEMEYD